MLQKFRWMQLVSVLQLFSCAMAFFSFSNETTTNAVPDGGSGMHSSPVRLIETNGQVILDNGISRVTLTVPDGTIVGIKYGGIENLLDQRGHGYGDIDWRIPGEPSRSRHNWLNGVKYSVVKNTEDQVELSFRYRADTKNPHSLPFGYDKRFVMLRGVSGFYIYAIYERPQGAPDVDIYQTRMVFKLNPDKFVHMVLSDKRRKNMPTSDDHAKGQRLGYDEAVLLKNPSNPDLRGTVDDKYMFSAENKDIKVHGWISSNPGVGFWVITPSYEFVGGGPMKQDLTSHVGPVSLAMFISTHYAGVDIAARFRGGEPWKKVFGPVFAYLNSNQRDHMTLWDDAKRQMSEEVGKWPYKFPMSQDFHPPNQRATVSGELRVYGSYSPSEEFQMTKGAGSNAYVGLAAPGPASSWQIETKGYQFWVQANGNGGFQIRNVVPGTYNLYAWIPGYLGEYVSGRPISVKPGDDIKLGQINFEPVRYGVKLWEIGIPDRKASEFYIPEPDPKFTSGLYSKHHFDLFREYGLWDRYAELYPKEDLTFTANHDEYQKKWFFAQVTRKQPDNTFKATTWRIFFTLNNVSPNNVYKLRIAVAAATYSELQVRINGDPSKGGNPHFTTGLFGRDNSIARHGSHGLYNLFNIDIPGAKLVMGKNTLYLTQSRLGPYIGVMYDYIRFEGPTL